MDEFEEQYPEFDFQTRLRRKNHFFDSSSDKSQQNADANQQIAQNKSTALQSLAQYQAANPGPLAGAAPPTAPQQYGGMTAGQNFGGPQGQNPVEQHLRRALQMQQPQGPPQAGFQGQPQPGGSQMPGQMPPQAPQQIPAGLLGLLQNRPQPGQVP